MFSCGRKKCEVAHWPSFTQSLDQPLVEFDERRAQGIFQTTLLEEPCTWCNFPDVLLGIFGNSFHMSNCASADILLFIELPL